MANKRTQRKGTIHGCGDVAGCAPDLPEYYSKKVLTEHAKDEAVQAAISDAANDYTHMVEKQKRLGQIEHNLECLSKETENYLREQAEVRAELKVIATRVKEAAFKAVL